MPPDQALTIYARPYRPDFRPPQMSVPLTPDVLAVIEGDRLRADVPVTFTPARHTRVGWLDEPAGPHACVSAPRDGTTEPGMLTREDGFLRVTVRHDTGDVTDSLPVMPDDARRAISAPVPRPLPRTADQWRELTGLPRGASLLLRGEIVITVPPAGEERSDCDVTETHEDGACVHVTGVTRAQAQAIARGICEYYVAAGISERAGHASLHASRRGERLHTFTTRSLS